MRRSITVLFLIAIVALIAWWLWAWKQVGAVEADPWKAVPADAIAVFEIPAPLAAWGRFTGTSQFWGDLEHVPACSAVNGILGRFAKSLAGEPALIKELDKSPLLIAWGKGEAKTKPMVMAWPVPHSSLPEKALSAAFGVDLPSSFWSGTPVELKADSTMPTLHVAWSRGLLLIGTGAGVIAQASAKKPRVPDSLFQKARASFSTGGDAHLLARPAFVSAFLGSTNEGVFPGGLHVDGWFAMDVRSRPEAVLMNGLLFPSDSFPAMAAVKGQSAGKLDITRVLPANVARLRAMRVQDPMARVRSITGKVPDDALFSTYAAWVQGGLGVAEAPFPGDTSVLRWAVFGTEDPGKAMAALRSRCPDAGCQVTFYRGMRITRTVDPGALEVLFGAAFAPFKQASWTVLSDMVVMSDTPAGMRAAIDAWTDRNSLALDPRSGDFFRRFGSEAVYSWWADVANAFPAGNGPWAKARQATGGCLLQMEPRHDGTFTTTFCLQHAPVGKRNAGTLWTAALPAPLEKPPILVKDYLSKTLQVLVQDRDHRISLISCTGKILWQRMLDGPIIGGVHQLDRYKNDKLQMVFNTAGSIYQIDRLGRDVEGFPKKLEGSACAPLALFDYDGRKDYRIVLPLKDGTLLDLAVDGKPVSGWVPEALPSPARAAVELVRIKGKDYLVVPMRDGRIAVLDRRGKERYSSKLVMKHIVKFIGSREAMAIADRRMLWADSAGAVLSGALNGEVDTLSQAASGKVAVFDVDGDGHEEVLRTTVAALTAEQNGKAVFRVTFPDAPGAKAFEVPMEGGDAAVGLVLPVPDQLRMYDSAGELWPGFPLKGAVRFSVADINLDGVPELVTADSDGVVTVYVLPAGR